MFSMSREDSNNLPKKVEIANKCESFKPFGTSALPLLTTNSTISNLMNRTSQMKQH